MCCGRTREHSPTEHQSIRILGAHQNKCKGELSSLPALNATRAKLHVRLLPLQMYNHSSGTHLQSSFVDATCSRVRYLTKSTTQKVSFQSPDTSRTRKTWVHVYARSSVDRESFTLRNAGPRDCATCVSHASHLGVGLTFGTNRCLGQSPHPHEP